VNSITYGPPSEPVDAIVTDDPAQATGAPAVYFLPLTPNGRGISDAWSAAADGEPGDDEPRLLVISGDEAARDPSVRALAEKAMAVIGIGMFEDSFRGLADLVLPGTSYLERDGTTVNLEGRLQRQRRAVLAPVPDVLAWLAKLAGRFDVELSPHASVVFDEIAGTCFGGISLAELGDRAPLPAAEAKALPAGAKKTKPAARGKGLRLVAYRPLFSGAAVERTAELDFQRPEREVWLSPEDAGKRKIRNGAPVTVSSNGTSVELRARIARDLAPGAVRIAAEHAGDLHATVEVKAAL